MMSAAGSSTGLVLGVIALTALTVLFSIILAPYDLARSIVRWRARRRG